MQIFARKIFFLMCKHFILTILICSTVQASELPIITDLEFAALQKAQSSFINVKETVILKERADRKLDIIVRMNCHLKLDGEINKQSADRLILEINELVSRGFNENIFRESINEFTICLNSQGGYLNDAIRIAESLKDLLNDSRRVTMTVRSGDTCLSSCALVFMLGFECHKASCWPSRFIQPGGMVGFHAPYLERASVEAPTRLLDDTYDQALKHLAFFLIQGNRKEFTTTAPRYPQGIIQNILSHGRDEFFYIDTIEKALFYGVDIIGAAQSYPHALEGVLNFCNNDTRRKNNNPFTYFPAEQIVQIEVGSFLNARYYQLWFPSYNWGANTSYVCTLGETQVSWLEGSEYVNYGVRLPIGTKQNGPTDAHFESGKILFDGRDKDNTLRDIGRYNTKELTTLREYIEDEFNAWMFWPGDTKISNIVKP